ncbi:hypothetical protein BGX27_004439 [Mortierella sp. AM989]|nr:hypothetical protein BGX27_004439 [Mortierella sp. AM989]
MSSPSIGPLSPYPTPQNYPQYQSSPHQSPRYESHQPKHSIPPSMSLPASSLSSTSVFQVLPSRPYPAPHSSSQSTNNSTSHGSQLKSPRSNVSQRSAPNSPQRFMMLPPQTAPTMALARQSGTQSKTSSATGTKRRSSSGAKAVDQETREMMRKVSHSAIERRRRERINDKILQLKHLVPACVDEDHLHKLSILQSTIEYIQYLKSVIPESIANAKFQKATNNNPNNKTTDMLEALGSNSSTMSFAPMMTTGLDHPYSKRTKSDQSSGSRQDTPNSGSANHPDDLRRPSATQSLSDEDAKDGLMLLSQMSSGALSTNASSSHARERRTRSQSSGGSLSMDREKNNDTMEYRNKTRQSKKSKGNDNDDDEDEEAFHNGSEDSGDSEDEEYLGDDVVEASGMEDIQSKEGPSCQNSKMSVEQMLC